MIGEIQHPYQVKDLMKIEVVLIDRGQGLLLVNLSPHLHV